MASEPAEKHSLVDDGIAAEASQGNDSLRRTADPDAEPLLAHPHKEEQCREGEQQHQEQHQDGRPRRTRTQRKAHVSFAWIDIVETMNVLEVEDPRSLV